MSVPGITFRALDGAAAAAAEDDLLALTARERPGVADADYLRQLRVWRRQPGFVLVEAGHGGYLVGYAAGMPLRPSTSWWKDVTAPLPDEVTAEHPGRTFALTALLVRAAWRRQGIGTGLHRLILAGRPEERASVTVSPAATAAQRALRAWGWQKVARARVPGGGESVRDVLLLFLPLTTAPGNVEPEPGNVEPQSRSSPNRDLRPQDSCNYLGYLRVLGMVREFLPSYPPIGGLRAALRLPATRCLRHRRCPPPRRPRPGQDQRCRASATESASPAGRDRDGRHGTWFARYAPVCRNETGLCRLRWPSPAWAWVLPRYAVSLRPDRARGPG